MKCDSCGAPVENGKCTYCGKNFTSNMGLQSGPCPRCGAVVYKGAVKCNNCGMSFVAPQPQPMGAMKTCKYCQAKIPQNAKTCPNCKKSKVALVA